MPIYGYNYCEGQKIIDIEALTENEAHIKACKWAIKTENHIQPMGELKKKSL